MQAILLCAGSSSRMAPLGDKVFFEFQGKSLLLHQIETLISIGWNDIIIVANAHNKDKILLSIQNIKEVKIHIVEQIILEDGMKGAIEVCKKFITKDAFILNSNDIVDKSILIKIKEESQKRKYDSIICGKVVKKYFPGGYLSVNSGLLSNIIEKPGEGNEPSNLVNLVLHYFYDFQSFAQYVENISNSSDDAYEQALCQFAQKNKVFVLEYSGFWQAIKYPWHILDLFSFFCPQISFIHPSAQISEKAIIKGNVYIEEGVKIFENSVIVGPCYIGKNSIIANNTLIRESYIGENSVIGFSTEVARSYLFKNVWTHSNYIGDSIIDENVSFGAGTITGNLRLDECEIFVDIKGQKVNSQKTKLGSIIGSGSRIGTQCSINPGIKIGKNVFIGSGINIQKNVDNEKYIYIKQEICEKENLYHSDVTQRK